MLNCMESDIPFWENLREVSAWSRYLKFGAVLIAAIVGFAIWGIESRKHMLEARRDGPRRVTDDLRQQLLVWLQPHQGTDIWFMYSTNDPEVELFRNDLIELFNSAHWIVNRGGIHAWGTNEPLTQIEIQYYQEDTDAITSAARSAARAFNRLGYNFRVRPIRMANGANFNPGTIVVRIGKR